VTALLCRADVLISLITTRRTAEKLKRPLIISTRGGATLPHHHAQVEALGAEIIHVYGLTEVYGPYTVCEWQPHWNDLPPEEQARVKARQGVGYIIADDVRVVDEHMRTSRRRRRPMGEVIMRGNNTMKGLLPRPLRRPSAPSAGGWFHTGDLA
jgi:fatty-acyl-CoA synthase